MAQTTNSLTFKDNKLEISTDGTTFTDISGHSNKVTVDGGERAVEELFTFDGDTADAQEVLRAAYEAGSAIYARWSPAGGATGDFQYTTGAGVVVSNPYPGGEAESADVMAAEYKIAVPSITKAAVA